MDYTPAAHLTQNWLVTKPSAKGKRGMVVSQVRAAAEVGVAILDAGGNAIDAAVATALALATVEPWNSGLGGIGFALVHRSGERRADVVDFGPVAPRGLDPSAFKLTGRMGQELFAMPEVVDGTNVHGPLSVAIPSSVSGYARMHEMWGRLPFAEVIAPAIALAKRGLPQDWFTTLKIAASAAMIRRYPESARIYLPGGLPPIAPYQGRPAFLQQGKLSATMEQLAKAGPRDFYEGEIAASIAADIKAMDGVLSAQDLRNCQARIMPATEYNWRGRTLQLTGGLTAAPTMMRVLDQMAGARFGAAPDGAWYVALGQAMKTAYGERLEGLGDADPLAAESCTSHVTTCDQDGTMVAMTTTLLSSMGSRVVLPGSGVLLNNGVMWFDPTPGRPNSIGGGKRPLTNMLPIILKDGDRPWLAAGASGGRHILASVTQLMSYIADFGMTAEQAAHHPRIDVSDPESVTADPKLSAEIMAALAQDGPTEPGEHGVLPVNYANPNVILRSADGTVTGVSDVMSPWSLAVAQA
jgi:gamma-glutamyltranspeptidase/glutathione hydrolase